jgi:hypothetical protein
LVVGEGAVDEHGAGEAVEGRVKGEDALDEGEDGAGGFVLAVLVEGAEEAVGGDDTAGRVSSGTDKRLEFAYPIECATRTTPTFRSFGGQGLSRCSFLSSITRSFNLR